MVRAIVAGALTLTSGAAQAQDFVASARPDDAMAVEATHYLAQTGSAAIPQATAVGTAWGGYDAAAAEDGLFQGGLALGRAFGETRFVMNVLYGTDGEGDDHEGEARVGVLRHLFGGFHLGAEGRYMHSLASTDPKREAARTPRAEALVGPMVALSVSTWTMVIEGGLATREATGRETRAFGTAGLGRSF